MKKSERWIFVMAILMVMLMFAEKQGFAEGEDASGGSSGLLVREAPALGGDDPFSEIFFPTIYKTGFDVCTNEDGLPMIFLFSSSTCAHCEWVGEVFDLIAKYYTVVGSIEAHHYDIHTGDDLLTEEVETQIPPAHLQLMKQGDPKELVPYFNFSCKYERVGNGYEKEDDIEAEGAEIRKVIETLIQVLPKAEKKN